MFVAVQLLLPYIGHRANAVKHLMRSTIMSEQDESGSNSAATGPSRELPEAFTENQDQGVKAKEIYRHGGTSRDTHTSSGLNKADEGSAESFPASDAPSSMGSASTLGGEPGGS
jgi:hypothetical protein